MGMKEEGRYTWTTVVDEAVVNPRLKWAGGNDEYLIIRLESL